MKQWEKLGGRMSQRAVARALGISHAAVAQAERNAIVKICRALDLPIPYEPDPNRRGKRSWRWRPKR